MKRVLCIAGFLLFLTTSAYAVEISVSPEYWDPDLEAEARIEKTVVGDKIDFMDDLGMEDENILGATVDIKLGRSNHFLLSYWSVGYDGKDTNRKKRQFTFNGVTYLSTDVINSSFDLDVFELGYAFDLINFESFRVGFMLNANYYALDMELNTDPATVNSEEKIDLLFPLAGIRFGIGFLDNKVQLAGQFAGLWWQGSGFWDASAELSYHPVENVAITAGYRMIHLDVSDDDDSANLKLDGPTISATLRF